MVRNFKPREHKHSRVSISCVTDTLDSMLSKGANVNIYVFHGGTSFGFKAGSNSGPFQPCPTSYDYDAPITEVNSTEADTKITVKNVSFEN